MSIRPANLLSLTAGQLIRVIAGYLKECGGNDYFVACGVCDHLGGVVALQEGAQPRLHPCDRYRLAGGLVVLLRSVGPGVLP